MTKARDLSKSTLPAQSGNSGKYLTTDGTAQSWGALAASALTLISATPFSGVTSVNIDNVFSSTYDTYVVQLSNLSSPTYTDDLFLRMRYGSTTSTASYYGTLCTFPRLASSPNMITQYNASEFKLMDGIGYSPAPGASTLTFNNVGNSSQVATWHGVNFEIGVDGPSIVGGFSGSSQTYTGFNIYSSQNISGNVYVYGLAKA